MQFLGGDLTYLFSNVTRIKGFTDKQILGTNNRGDIKPYNLIGALTLQNNSLPSLANNNIITLADNNTIASLIEWNNTNNVNLSNYINSQISLLSQQLNNKIDTLISEVNTKINIINNDLINIHNELATKATLSYVNDAINNVWNTVNNHTTQINQHTTQIADIYSKLNSKVDKSVFEPWKQIVDDFMANTVQLPKGAIILWEGRNSANGTLDGSIPNNWEEVESLRGRVPVGWDRKNNLDLNIFGNNFYVLGDESGSAYVTLSAENIPKHRHRTAYYEKSGTLLHNVPDGAIATYRTASNTDADYELAGVNKEANVGWTSWSGGLNGSTQPFKALQPYKVLIYIRSKKGV
jgi:microcystin-dependent protein